MNINGPLDKTNCTAIILPYKIFIAARGWFILFLLYLGFFFSFSSLSHFSKTLPPDFLFHYPNHRPCLILCLPSPAYRHQSTSICVCLWCIYENMSVYMCLCLCMYEFMSVCMCLCLCLYMSVCMCLCLCLYMSVCMYLCLCKYTYMSVYIHMRMCVCHVQEGKSLHGGKPQC